MDADLRNPRGRRGELLHRQCQSHHRPVSAQRASAELLGNAGRAVHSDRDLHGIEHACSGRASSERLRQPDHLRVIKNSFGNWAGRLGLAYRLGDKTVVRGSYSRFYDAWADDRSALAELRRELAGGQYHSEQRPEPQYSNGDRQPIRSASAAAERWFIPSTTSARSASGWWIRSSGPPYMDQWNIGVQRELPANMVLDANYVGSVGRHLDWGPTMNIPASGTGRCTSPAALPLHAAAMVRPERRRTAVTTPCRSPSTNVPAMASPSWSPTPWRIPTTTVCGTWVQTAIRSNPYNRQGRLRHLRPQPDERVLGGIYAAVAIHQLFQQGSCRFSLVDGLSTALARSVQGCLTR